MKGQNPQRTGTVESGLKPPYVVKWSFQRCTFCGAPASDPVVVSGTLYQGDGGSGDDTWALDSIDGTVLWNRTNTSTLGTVWPQWMDGNLYYGLGQDTLPGGEHYGESLDLTTQTVRWALPTTEACTVFAAPTVTYVLNISGTLYAVDDATGTVNWIYIVPSLSIGNKAQGPPSYADGVLYVIDQPVTALVDLGGSPSVLWRATDGPCNSPGASAIANGKVYAPCSGKIHAYDQVSGVLQWVYGPVGGTVNALSVVGDIIVFGSADDYLYAIRDEGSKASLVWNTDVGFATNGGGQPLITNGYVYAGHGGATTHAVNLATGDIEWSYTFPPVFPNEWVMADNLLYISPNQWHYCFGKPLNLSLAVDQMQANPGDTVTYTLTVNSYNGPTENITLVATLPAQLIYQSSSDGGALMGNMVVWNSLPITANTIKTITFTAQVDSTITSGSYDLAVQGFLDYPGVPADLTESLSEKVHTLVVLPIPTPPANLTALEQVTTIELAWEMAIPGVDPISGYNLYRATFSGLTASAGTFLVQTLGVAATAYSDGSVAVGVPYCYLVRAVDGNGVESADSNEACALIPIVPPTPPSNLTAMGRETTIELAWETSTPGSASVLGYNLYRATLSGFSVSVGTLLTQVLGATTTTYSDASVTKGIMYCYRIRAVDVNGLESGSSNEACAKIPLPPQPLPYTGPVRVFPNPYNPDTAARGTLKFEGLPVGAKVRIYTPEGLKVWEDEVRIPYLLEWDGRSEGGRQVAPGTYLWIAEGEGTKERGTLIVE